MDLPLIRFAVGLPGAFRHASRRRGRREPLTAFETGSVGKLFPWVVAQMPGAFMELHAIKRARRIANRDQPQILTFLPNFSFASAPSRV